MHDAEAAGFLHRHLHATDSDVRAAVDMLLEHQFIIHLVHMVARQDDHIFRRIAFDDVDILEDRVGRAFIPLAFRHALAGGQDVEAFIAFRAKEVPAALEMPDQRMRLVLGRNADAPDAAVERIGQGEIDDPGLAAEMHCGLCAPVGQFGKATAPAPGQYIGHGVTGDRLVPWLHRPLLLHARER